VKRQLTLAETQEVLSLTKKDITMSLLRDYFAIKKGKNKPKFNTFDTIVLSKGKFYNEEKVETTVGRYIFNMFVLPEKYLTKYGYQNVEYTVDAAEDLEKKLGLMLLNDEITSDDFTSYLNNGEWMTLGTAYFLVPTMDYDITIPNKDVIKRRNELFKQYAKEIEAGDPNVATKIEKELLELAAKKLEEGGNEGYDFYKSGEFKFSNNYKKTSVMSGAIENPYTKKLDIMKSNYADGISKEEFPYLANITIIGGYSRNVETQRGGYETKKINNSMQVITLDEPGTDCGTTHYLLITIPEKMKDMFIGRYVLDGGKITLITEKNVKGYAGKEVRLRSPMYCKSEQICSKCAGDLFYKLGMRNAGLLSSTLSGSLMNLSMKKFHDTSLKFKKIDPTEYIKQR
jgi:hypothetical protein